MKNTKVQAYSEQDYDKKDPDYLFIYHNDPKFSDRYAWANSADPDQESTLFAIPSASFGLITLW